MYNLGAELIAKERDKQCQKYGFDASHDMKYHEEGALASLAFFLAAPDSFELQDKNKGVRVEITPEIFISPSFDVVSLKNIRNKHNYVERLAIAGAFLAAEIDRHMTACTAEVGYGTN